MDLKEDTLSCKLALHRIPGLTVSHKNNLDQYFPDVRLVFSARKIELQQVPELPAEVVRQILDPNWHLVQRDLIWLEQPGHHFLWIDDTKFPVLLKEIHHAPTGLFVIGDPQILSSQQISMVGSRRPSAAGKNIANNLAAGLGKLGLTVTSGLAIGIDSCCHQGALSVNAKTVAVLGNGLDMIYPKKNQGLMEAIVESGAVVSEYPPGTPPLKQNFPARNRIISGLSLGTVVVEAARRSGSLITARLAMEQGREVFAVPGSIFNPLTRGCHDLIKQGAKLTENATDVIEEMAFHLISSGVDRITDEECKATGTIDDNRYKKLVKAIGFDAMTVNQLVEISGLTTAEVSSMLLNMEIDGVVETQMDGTYIRVSK